MSSFFPRIISFLFAVAGVGLLYTGIAYRGFNGSLESGMRGFAELREFAKSAVGFYKSLGVPESVNSFVDVSANGALYLLSPLGGILLLLGVLMWVTTSRRIRHEHKILHAGVDRSGAEEASGNIPSHLPQEPAAPAPSAAPPAEPRKAEALDVDNLSQMLETNDEKPGVADIAKSLPGEPNKKAQAGTFFIDESLLDDEISDKNLFYNINKIVAMMQSEPTEREYTLIMKILRPEAEPYTHDFSKVVKNRLCHQILQHHALRLKRGEQGISHDQFILQDKRMNETERETIFRRFMPQPDNLATMDDSRRKLIGRVYTIVEQSKVQHDTLSQTEDWQDISLRNLVAVMKTPLPSAPN